MVDREEALYICQAPMRKPLKAGVKGCVLWGSPRCKDGGSFKDCFNSKGCHGHREICVRKRQRDNLV